MVLLGPPGAGKGTQASALAGYFGVPAISTGGILRQEVEHATHLGQQVAPVLEAGGLVPDEVVFAVVRQRLAQADAADGFVLDGFPRSVGQAQALDAFLTAGGHPLDVVVDLLLDRDEVLRRLAGRGRADDDPDTVAARLDAYGAENGPLVAFYRAAGTLAEIDGAGPPGEVTARIVDATRRD
jgi:adenylate kinase